MSFHYFNYFREVQGKWWAITEAASLLLGIDPATFRAWAWANPHAIAKIKDDLDRRRSLFNLDDIISLLQDIEQGKVRSKSLDRLRVVDPEDGIIQEARQILSSTAFRELWRLISATGSHKENAQDSPVTDKGMSMGMASPSNLDDNVYRLFKRDDDLSPEEFDRHLSFVESTCWGWADETDPECREHCKLLSACAEARLSRFSGIARDLEIRDAANHRFDSLHREMERIRTLHDTIVEQVDGLFPRDTIEENGTS